MGVLRLSVIGCGMVVALSACGGSDDDLENRISRERAEAASQARQAERIKGLEAKLRQVERDAKRQSTSKVKTVVERESAPRSSSNARAAASGGGRSEVFHAPSGNVSCEVTAVSARCTVAKIGTTFRFDTGSGAATTGGEGLGRGAGYAVGWDTSVSVGSVSCRIPAENERAGIRCNDSSTGHGFEASAVSSRQKLY